MSASSPCTNCGGSGYIDGEICSQCSGSGASKISGAIPHILKYIFILRTQSDDILDKVNDIKEKVDEIKEVVDAL